MNTANTHLMLALADTRLNDLERRAKFEFPRFGWLTRRAARAQNTPTQYAPPTRRKAY